MQIEIPGRVELNHPAKTVWEVVGPQFANIGTWASQIPQSHGRAELQTLEGAPIGGRVCETAVAGFPAISERLTYYNEGEMRLKYVATEGLPRFVRSAQNDWTVNPIGADRSELTIRGEIDLRPFPGIFLYPFMIFQFKRAGKIILDDLAYYLDHGRARDR